MKFILGKKLNMTQVFKEDGTVVPVTAVFVEPNYITQIKSKEKDGYNAVQVGAKKLKKTGKSRMGQFKNMPPLRYVKEFRTEDSQSETLKKGDILTVEVFSAGDKVKVQGVSKGKGFQGVVKRHGFHGSPASHGHKDQLRMPGSIGATDAARVIKNQRMPGQMGNVTVTVTGLEIVSVDKLNNILYVKGAVPGARNGLLAISGEGEMVIQKTDEAGANKATSAKNDDMTETKTEKTNIK